MDKLIKKLIPSLFVLIILYFFIRTIYFNLDNIQNYDFEINLINIAISIFLVNLVVFLWSLYWKNLLKITTNIDLSHKKTFYIQSISWLGKYFPGKIGIVASKLYLGNESKVNKKSLVFSSIYENIFQVLTAFLVSIPIISFYFIQEIKTNQLIYQVLPLLFIIGILIFIQPKIFFYFINLGLKIIKKPKIEKKYLLSEIQIIKYLFLYSIGVIINGIAFFIFINSIIEFPIQYLIPTIGAFVFAGVIGLLAIFVPAGFGVREGILILFLQTLMPLEIAILISLLSRLWITIADGLLGLYVLGYKYFNK